MNKEALKRLEADLWRSADTLRANSDLKASEYSTPVLGLIFLKFADNKYRRHEQAILAEYAQLKGSRRETPISEIAIGKCGFYLPEHARYDYLLKLPEEKDIAKTIKDAMAMIEEYKPELQGALPQPDTVPQEMRQRVRDDAGRCQPRAEVGGVSREQLWRTFRNPSGTGPGGIGSGKLPAVADIEKT